MVPAVQVHTSVAVRDGRGAFGVVIRDVDGQVLRVSGRALGDASLDVASYRAILHGVWRAKRLGAQRVRVFTEHPEIVAQLEGHGEVPAELTGLYLQTKAMLNAYRWSRVELIVRELNADAASAAMAAVEQPTAPATGADEDDLDLPLWRWAEDAAAGASR
ncbi:MAG TPA: reverse transcriptase-like protein [bacterium]|nr:reverse transcriptase-like protein [bacterium]